MIDETTNKVLTRLLAVLCFAAAIVAYFQEGIGIAIAILVLGILVFCSTLELKE